MKHKFSKILLILVLGITIPFTTAFSSQNPKTLYRVYLKGKSIGLIESKEALENYIDKKQNEIKEKLYTRNYFSNTRFGYRKRSNIWWRYIYN